MPERNGSLRLQPQRDILVCGTRTQPRSSFEGEKIPNAVSLPPHPALQTLLKRLPLSPDGAEELKSLLPPRPYGATGQG